MGIVAVAGGLGDLGRSIVRGILSRGNQKVYILSRKEVKDKLEAEVVKVDYGSITSISNKLRSLSVDTVISTLNLHWEGASEAQINLIRASAMSKVVKRFIPSEFNIDYHNPEDKMPYGPRIRFLQAEEELNHHPELTYTLVRNGFFMDYLGLPFMPTTLTNTLYCLVDLPSLKMTIPGDGEEHVVFTHTEDVGKMVAGLLDIEAGEWPRQSAIIGERITLNELVGLVKSIWGDSFEVHYDSVDELSKNRTTELPSNKMCYKLFPSGKEELNSIICTQMIGMASGVFDIPGVDIGSLVDSVSMSIEELLHQCLRKSRCRDVDQEGSNLGQL